MKTTYNTAITSEMTGKEILQVLKETGLKYGKRGGLTQHVKIKEGWLIAVIYAIPGGYEHWNYHPGRTELTKTHTTIGRINTIEALDATIAALERLYPQETEDPWKEPNDIMIEVENLT